MEVSSTSGSSIVWSDDAKLLFVRLVAIDERNRSDKAEVFEGLYSLWKSNNIGTITVLTDSFIENKNFIKDMILSTLKIPKRKQIDTAQRIYDTLKLGLAFTTPEGNIIPNSVEDLTYWTKKRKNHQRLLNRRFNNLFNEFEEYLMYRYEENIEDVVYEAQNKVVAIRENPARAAKSKFVAGDYKGMTSSDTIGKKRTEKKSKTDEVNISLQFIYII